MDSKLSAMIKKQARPKLFSSIFLIIVALAILFFYRSFVKSKTLGADEVSTYEGVISHFDSGDKYISVYADYLYPLDLVVETTTTENGRVKSVRNTSFFAVMYIEDMLMAVELPYKLYNDETFTYEDITLTGKLKASTDDFDVIGEVSNEIAAIIDVPSSMVAEQYLIHIYLDTQSDTTAIMLTFIACALFVFALITFILNLFRIVKPKNNRVYKQMRGLGDEEIIETALEREIADGSSDIIAHPSNYSYLTKTYILAHEKGKFSLGKTEDIAWAYRRDVKNRGVATHYIVLRMKDGKSRRTLTAKLPNDAENAMKAIFSRLPVLCGYTAELEKTYNKNKPEFDRLLEARRAEFAAGPYTEPMPEE